MDKPVSDTAAVVEELKKLARFQGPPEEFWPQFLDGVIKLAGAKAALLTVQGADKMSWRNLSLQPVDQRNAIRDSGLGAELESIATAVVNDGPQWRKSPQPAEAAGAINRAYVIEIENDPNSPKSVLALFFSENLSRSQAAAIATQLAFAVSIPSSYQIGRLVHQIQDDSTRFTEALDLMVLMNDQKKYMGAAMTLCNELSSRFSCSRVSLGWLENNYVRVQAISHIEKFQKKMDAVQNMEAAMEETFDQDEEIVYPRPADNTAVTREHETFAKEQGGTFLLSLPIRVDNEPVGVVMCERQENEFSEEEIRSLRVQCDQVARRLADLKKNDKWFGARFAVWSREQLAEFLGPKHTFIKLAGIAIGLALMFLLFGRLQYRVEAPFILKTDDLAFIPAPFDGYIDDVKVDVGDIVAKGTVLLDLDIKELLLQESTEIANQNRYAREAEKARAQNALADMNISLALKAQATAKLKQVRYHLAHAELKAPFAGVVVEGDLKELLGAPVRKGDVLFKVARLEKMYAELEVDERDVQDVKSAASGEIAFISRPNLKFPVRVDRVDPVAVAKKDGNVFKMRCSFADDRGDKAVNPIYDWWRPGMSGVAKINVGKRNVLWILTHRTVDFFRILLWW